MGLGTALSMSPQVPANAAVALMKNSQIALEELCTKIADFPSLQSAIVVATECYVKKSLVRHRYLVLELQHPEGFTTWLRLDRRRGIGSLVPFVVFGLFTSPAHDTVNILSYL